MHKGIIFSTAIASAAFLLSSVTARAADDWLGAFKAQASYTDVNNNRVEITVDVVYDKPGAKGDAWGTMSYQRAAQGDIPALQVYYHALCVGVFDGGNKYSVAGPMVKTVGAAQLHYMTYEFDIVNKGWRTFETDTLQEARRTCATQSGLFPGTFNHGYVVAK